MTDLDLADRILAALRESDRLDRRPVVRSDQVLARLTATEAELRGALYAPDTQDVDRFTRGFVASDVVVLRRPPPAPPDDAAQSGPDRTP